MPPDRYDETPDELLYAIYNDRGPSYLDAAREIVRRGKTMQAVRSWKRRERIIRRGGDPDPSLRPKRGLQPLRAIIGDDEESKKR